MTILGITLYVQLPYSTILIQKIRIKNKFPYYTALQFVTYQSENMEFKEIYCITCEKIIGRYNIKFYNEDKIAELMKTSHVTHVRNGHQINIRKYIKN